jgi:hypothetical protein
MYLNALNGPYQRVSYIKYIFTLLYQTEVLIIGQMDVCMIEMNSTIDGFSEKKTYYVYGSGLFAVPGSRINEIPRLRSEHHAAEAKRAWAFAQGRIHS